MKNHEYLCFNFINCGYVNTRNKTAPRGYTEACQQETFIELEIYQKATIYMLMVILFIIETK